VKDQSPIQLLYAYINTITIQTMSRPVYIVIFHSPMFAAHWALWIPSYENETAKDVGRMIHVEGSPANGFTLEFRRNYDLSLTSRPKSVLFLCWVDAAKVVEVPGDYTKDTTPADVIDQWALSVMAPGPSLRSASASVSPTIDCLLGI